jgi:hypothetical protein
VAAAAPAVAGCSGLAAASFVAVFGFLPLGRESPSVFGRTSLLPTSYLWACAFLSRRILNYLTMFVRVLLDTWAASFENTPARFPLIEASGSVRNFRCLVTLSLTTTSATATATTFAVAASASATEPTATTAPSAFTRWTSFVDHDPAAHEVLAVEGLDGAVSVIVVGHFDEAEPTRLSREAIPHQGYVPCAAVRALLRLLVGFGG